MDRGDLWFRAKASAGCVLSTGQSTNQTVWPGRVLMPAQCGLWRPPRRIPLKDDSKSLPPALAITTARSRFVVGQIIPTRHTEDLPMRTWIPRSHRRAARRRRAVF